MKTLHITNEIHRFLNEIKDLSAIDLKKCYQCGKCSAGCPMAFQMSSGGGSAGDYPPAKLIRHIQLGERERVLSSSTIWVCVSCITCSSRCPKEIEIADLMDVLRELSIKEGLSTKEQRKIQQFHKSFLEVIRSNGRLYEMMLIAKYKLRTLALFQDVDKTPKMLFSGKLKLLPHKVEKIEEIKRIFEKCEE
ncbi:MAG: 4Fe-4S dicluster domain-containing protein [Planctomycetota bacterium]|nr:4Fe-4S dicluster domain-containing protein [Planctomycetota bacterium]